MSLTRFSLARTAIALSIAAAAALAHAAPATMRPGLWEMSAYSRLASLVNQVPPEQMSQLGALAKQYGFEMPKVQNGAVVTRVCITPEMAAQKVPPYLADDRSGCEARNVNSEGNRYSADIVCTGGQVSGTGRAEGVLASPESFTSRTRFTGNVQGLPVDETADTSGRWVAADCGTLKPGGTAVVR